MIGNASPEGGVVNHQPGGSMVLKGRGDFAIGNNGSDAGGVFGIRGGGLQIDGRRCASGNKAGFSGGFAVVEANDAELRSSEAFFSDNIQTCCGNTFQNTVVMSQAGVGKAVRCGVDAPSWADNKLYGITGAACACNESFVAATSPVNECNTAFPADCDPSTWQDTCVSVPARVLSFPCFLTAAAVLPAIRHRSRGCTRPPGVRV